MLESYAKATSVGQLWVDDAGRGIYRKAAIFAFFRGAQVSLQLTVNVDEYLHIQR